MAPSDSLFATKHFLEQSSVPEKQLRELFDNKDDWSQSDDYSGYIAQIQEHISLTKKEIVDAKNNTPPRKIMLNLVQKLSENYRLFLLSDQMKFRTNFISAEYLSALPFEKSYFSSETGLLKPNPKTFQQILTENDLKVEETIFVDDRKNNIEAANKLGIHGVLFTSYEDLKVQLEKYTIS